MSFFHFSLPSATSPEHILSEFKPTCIVGLIGHSRSDPSSMASIINSSLPGAQFVLSKSTSEIQCFFDGDQGILYMYVGRHDDINKLKNLQQLFETQNSHLVHHQEMIKLKHEEIKTWLWLFSVCHFVVVLHPSQSFDVEYIRLFRTTQQLLQHFAPKIKELYPETELLTTARIYRPRLLFVFQSNSASMHLPPKKGRQGFNQQCKRLGLEMETQIFHIFRKCRLLPKQASRGAQDLAHLPPPNELREPFVLFLDGKGRPSSESPSFKHVDTALYYISQLSATAPQYVQDVKEDTMTLGSFLKRNVKNLRNQVLQEKEEGVTFVPLGEWYSAAILLYSFYCHADNDANFSENGPAKIIMQLDPEGQYSENRCQKAYPVASAAYMDSLPSHYTHAIHQRQLQHALHILRSRAKGPAFSTYAAKLKEDCDAIWEDGRKGCESISLTGNACVLPLHDSARVHSNRLRMRSACSCGRSISYRSDPFTLESANHEFYMSLSDKCCSTLPQHRLFGRNQLSWMICNIGPASSYQTTMGIEQPGFLLGSQYLLPWDLPPDEAWAPEPKNAWRGKRSVRCYVGYEYECSKGHRFYCSAGGAPVKGSPANMIKENSGGNNVMSDMILYTTCPSHTNKPLLGQLMRIVVCSPEQVSLSVCLNVSYRNIRISLTAPDNVQIPGGKMTVIRLPYVYCDESDNPLPFDIEAYLCKGALIPMRSNRRRNDKK
ncbi:nonsense-mediated mRNA decay factor SMG8-like isoform X1 [Bolinopsis microptera]|uniref:nonsense-mediated mRNA decay factor SMG8-like isoform X1 n=2 Tax=Bolinopsis microptera TaxID=2820187 RepID=UPI0030796538